MKIFKLDIKTENKAKNKSRFNLKGKINLKKSAK